MENPPQTSPAIPTAQPLGVQLVEEWDRLVKEKGLDAAIDWAITLSCENWQKLMEAKHWKPIY